MVRSVSWTMVVGMLGLASCNGSAHAGSMYACDVYNYGPNAASKLYEVNPLTGAIIRTVGELRTADGTAAIAFGSSLAFDTSGALWGVDGHTHRIGIINTTNAQVALLPVSTRFPADTGFVSGIAFDPVTNALYAVCESSSYPNRRGFYEINKTTGEYDFLASTTVALPGISFGSDGVLYGVTYNGQLYRIDPDNAFSLTYLGASGTLHGIRDLTVFGDGPGVSLFAENDASGSQLATIQIGPPNTSSIRGSMTSGNPAIDGLAYSDLGTPPVPVPEPSSFALVAAMGMAVLTIGWRRKRLP